MSGMFFGMSGLKTLELGNFDTHNVTDMSSMFYSLYELKNWMSVILILAR